MLCVTANPFGVTLLLDPCHFYFGSESVSSLAFRTRWQMEHPHERTEPFVGLNGATKVALTNNQRGSGIVLLSFFVLDKADRAGRVNCN